MRKKLITVAVAAMAAVTSGYVLYRRAHSDAVPAYRTATVQRGDIESTVAATGTLGAVTTVQVGTQVSGQISAIYVDFNVQGEEGPAHRAHRPDAAAAGGGGRAGGRRARAGDAHADQARVRAQQAPVRQKIVTDAEFNTAQLNYAAREGER